MASNPPFQVEDTTDEDFFDKLVNDDDDDIDLKGEGDSFVASNDADFVDDNDSDEANTFANLSSGEVGGDEKNGNLHLGDNVEVGGIVEGKQDVLVSGNLEGNNGPFVGGEPFGLDSTAESNCGNNSSANSSDCTMVSKSSGSLGSGIKEVGWSAFHTYSGQGDTNAFGSYSDLLTGLGVNADDSVGNPSQTAYTGVSTSYDHYQTGNSVGNVAEAKSPSQAAYTGVSTSYDQYQAGYDYGTASEQGNNVQDTNSIEYWESLYPGWKIDPATGQWYQVDVNNSSTNVQGNLESNAASAWPLSDGQSEVSYLQKSAESVAETMAESGRTESVTNLNATFSNQNLQETENTGVASEYGGYPSNMVFDPQYPGWYYDTIIQEWRSLDSYTASAQSAIQGQNDGSNSYSQNDVQNPYVNQYTDSQSFSNHEQNSYNPSASGVWEPERVIKDEIVPNYGMNQQQETDGYRASVSDYGKRNQVQSKLHPVSRRSHSFVSGDNFTPQFDHNAMSRSHSFVSRDNFTQTEQKVPSNEYFGNNNSPSFSQQSFHSPRQYSFAPTTGRSSAGRPPHALVTFGFGGKLITMKETASLGNFSFPSQNPSGYSVSVLNISEVITENADSQTSQPGTRDYFHALYRQSLPGPLLGGNVGTKELNKWVDERLSTTEFSNSNFRLRQLLSLLKIACQFYGKLRSPFGSDPILKENDLPGPAVAELFSSSKRNPQYGSVAHCLQGLPSEAHLRGTAAEVQSLLVSGRKKEALYCAQEGQLWGPALVLASQLGNQFYVDTVKQLALRQLVAGSPLRTLCLLIAGQPADVFSAETAASGSMPGDVNSPQQSMQSGANDMLDGWEENLAVIASNRTKDDELVLIHLGDCLWRERADIFAAHICYLVAETNFEQYSDSARLCLVGADHLKFPRTYASPEAIQRTEIYEYSQVLGNSQFVLFPFQPYKLVYAHMLAEVGRVSDALKYCQAVQKSLKTGRTPEVETLRHIASTLEARIKTHQQGGFSTTLVAPKKLFDKMINLFQLPPTVPTAGSSLKGNEHLNQNAGPRVSSSQSTMAMSSLMPNTSVEPTNERTGDVTRRPMHSRSASEPDFGRRPRQGQVDSPKDANNQGKTASRFGRFGFGSQLFQKTVGLVLKPRQGRQAKLGDSNKFYYDEKLKRWVEEGAELPAQEPALPPPPPTNMKNAARDDGNLGSPDYKNHTPSEHSSGMPPLPPTSTQFSARGRMGVRSRYVDTFNQGGGNPTNLFSSPSPSVLSPKPAAAGTNPKFFVPGPVSIPEKVEEFSATDENPSVSTINEVGYPPAPISPVPMQRYPSMDNLSSQMPPTKGDGKVLPHSRRTVSWSGGSFNYSRSPTKKSELKPLSEVLGMPRSPSPLMHSSNGENFGDELDEVEL